MLRPQINQHDVKRENFLFQSRPSNKEISSMINRRYRNKNVTLDLTSKTFFFFSLSFTIEMKLEIY